jgi:hypothetical protein
MKKHSSEETRLFCRIIGEELRDLVASQVAGEFDPPRFVASLLEFEAEVARRHELVITASNTIDDWTVMKVYVQGDATPCASFEFLPQAGQFREVTDCGQNCSKK